MNYAAHYDRLIARARDRGALRRGQTHHVLPRCMAGDDSPENKVRLTPQEHYVAHQLLVKMYPQVPQLAHGAVRMARRCSGKMAYGWLRRRHALALSQARKGVPLPPHVTAASVAARRGKPLTTEHREKLSATMRERGLSPEHVNALLSANLGQARSPETRARISARRSGIGHTAETRALLSVQRKGRPVSESARAKMSATRKGRKFSPEHRAALAAAHRARHERRRQSLAEGQQPD